ncbi:MAG: CaiB/BaiF CoA-transferase family protein [Antricoccus sp.]
MLEQALDGIKVLDMSRILAGPWCGQNLADLGADVIKIENPDGGDDTRSWGPPFAPGTGPEHGFSSYLAACNRGKRSLAVNFADPDGRAIIEHLAADADVFLENYKSGTLDRYGIGYADLKKINPRLVYCSITGFGQTGPMAGKPGYDFVFQGAGGLMSYTGQPDGRPGAEPLRCGISVMDLSTGLYATSAVIAALFQRDRTGVGQFIDMALLDVSVAINANHAQNYLHTGKPSVRYGNAHPTIAPYEVFPCSDGFIILAVANDSQFAKFTQAADRPDLAADMRLRTNAGRVIHRDELRDVVTDIMKSKSRAQWGDLFEDAGVPWGPINDLADVFADEQVIHRGMRVEAEHPVTGPISQVRNPMLYGSAFEPDRVPPLNGEHTASILAEHGYSDQQIADLVSQGAIGVWSGGSSTAGLAVNPDVDVDPV